MAILLTGGTGKTSKHIARFLQKSNIAFLLAYRKGETAAPSGMSATKFDWLDYSTHEHPFQHKFANGERITAVYLIAPGVQDPAPSMNAFVDLAVQKHDVKRFVLLSGSSLTKDGSYTGQVWQHLDDIGVDHTVILATWFMENFSIHSHQISIKEEGKIYTACQDGKIPFVGARDIAAVAFHALTDAKPHNTDYRILGPELLTYDEVAAKFSSGLGRKVVHVRCSEQERIQQFMSMQMPQQLAQFVTSLEVLSANGAEDRMNDVVETVTGRPPQNLDAWVEENKTAWL